MSAEGKINNPVPSPEECESIKKVALERVGLMASKFAENQKSFERRADLVDAYKKVSLDLTAIPATLQKYYSLNFGSNLYSLATYGFEEGIFHYILRADIDLSQYPSSDPDWEKIRDCVHEAGKLIRSIANKAGLTIDSPKLFEPVDKSRDDIEYQMPKQFTHAIPEFGDHIQALAKERESGFGVSVRYVAIEKEGKRLRPNLFVGMNPGEWGV